MRRIVLLGALLIGSLACGPAVTTAYACPMCKYANEADPNDEEANRRPRAYMYSILFMLSMPATLFTGFSLGFYRLWKKQQELNEMATLAESPDDAES